MKKNIYILSLLLGSAFGFMSCDKAMEDNFPSEFESVLHFCIQKGEHEIDVKLLNTGEAGNYNFSIGKSGNNLSATAEGTITTFSEGELETYNDDHSTSYVILPDEYYTLSTDKLSFNEKENNKSVDVTFQTSQMHEDLDLENKQYVLPLHLGAQGGASVNEVLNMLILKPIVSTPIVTLELPEYQKFSMNVTVPEITSQTIMMPVYVDLSENKWNFNVTVETNEESLQAIVDQYNDIKGVDYQLLPAGNHNLLSKISFAPGDIMLTKELTINRGNLPEGDYLLPIKLLECTEKPFDVNSTIRYIHLSLNNELPEITLTPAMLHAASENFGEQRPAANMLDGFANTYWQNAWQFSSNASRPNDPKYGLWLDIELKEAIKTFAFAYQTPSNNNYLGLPEEFDVYVGNSMADMTAELQPISIFTHEKDGLPKTNNQAIWFKSDNIYSNTPFKYIRFAFRRSMEGKDLTKKAPGSIWIAELEIYGR